jgi:hypothetical protein
MCRSLTTRTTCRSARLRPVRLGRQSFYVLQKKTPCSRTDKTWRLVFAPFPLLNAVTKAATRRAPARWPLACPAIGVLNVGLVPSARWTRGRGVRMCQKRMQVASRTECCAPAWDAAEIDAMRQELRPLRSAQPSSVSRPHHSSIASGVAREARQVARPARIELAAPRLGGGCSIR